VNELNHGLVGAYAADALDEHERAEFEAHLEECPDCRADVASLQEATATLSEATATVPPPELRGRVMAQIGAVRPLPPIVDTVDELAVARGRRRRFLAVVGSAAAAVVLAVGLGVTQPWADDLGPAEQVMQADDAISASIDLADGATATVVHSDSLDSSVISTEDMPPPPDGSVYQLWYAEDGSFTSAGLMGEGSEQTVQLEGDSRAADGVGITVEPDGGSQQPTSEPIAMFDIAAGDAMGPAA
jgi:anti-sigma-K factor RskA